MAANGVPMRWAIIIFDFERFVVAKFTEPKIKEGNSPNFGVKLN
jgi:hypothetical protein